MLQFGEFVPLEHLVYSGAKADLVDTVCLRIPYAEGVGEDGSSRSEQRVEQLSVLGLQALVQLVALRLELVR